MPSKCDFYDINILRLQFRTGRDWGICVKRIADHLLSFTNRQCAALICAAHAIALLSFGSVMWVDAASYIRIAQAFTSIDAMRAVYDGSTLWWHNYVAPGVPLIWLSLRELPTEAIWPVLAIGQHTVAAIALIYAVRSARLFAPSRGYAVAAVLLCLYPYYQAFHNSLGTESLASSLLLLGFSVVLRAFGESVWNNVRLAQLLALTATASLFRHSIVLLLTGFAFALIIRHRRLAVGPIVLTALVAAVSFFWYPAARSLTTGEFIKPRPGLSSLFVAPRINLDPSPAARDAIAAVDWPQGLTSQQILDGKFSYAQFEQVARAWRLQGLSNAQVLDRFEELGKALRHDGWQTEVRAVAHGLVAAGINTPCLLPPAAETYTRAMSNAAACESSKAWTEVFAWMAADRATIKRLFDGSFRDTSVPDLQLFEAAWMRWFKEYPPRMRDPIFLNHISLTVITLVFFVAAILVLRRNLVLGLCLLGLPLVTVYLHAAVPFGGTRYTYPLLPIYVLAVPIALALNRRGSWRSEIDAIGL